MYWLSAETAMRLRTGGGQKPAHAGYSASSTSEANMDFFLELVEFLMHRKKYWLLPIILIMLLVGLLLISVQNSVVAPFIYTLF
jgi:hypothetical protein